MVFFEQVMSILTLYNFINFKIPTYNFFTKLKYQKNPINNILTFNFNGW